MHAFFDSPARLLAFGNALLWTGLATLGTGLLGAYLLDELLGMALQVMAHGLTILGPTLLKVGYVIRLTAQCHRTMEDRHAAV